MKLQIKHLITAIAMLISIYLLVGCAALGPSFESPKVSLANIQVLEVRNLETVFLVELRVLNPNDTDLEIRGINCDLELDGRHFATGIQGERYTLPAYGSTLIPLEVYASVIDMVSSIVGLIQTPGKQDAPIEIIEYSLDGKIRISDGGISANLPFASIGEISL